MPMRSEGPPRRAQGRVRPRNPSTVPSRWAAFLSCDARDMCWLGPALVRNYLAFLAVSVRVISMWALISLSFCRRIESDIYWASRTDHPDYPEMAALVDGAHEIRDDILRQRAPSRRTSDSASRALAQSGSSSWERARDHFPNELLSLSAWGIPTRGPSCPPFRLTRQDELIVLTAERIASAEYVRRSYEGFAF